MLIDMHSDLPLFAFVDVKADVIPFPCRYRIAKVRRAAVMIEANTDRGAEAYWRRTVSDLRKQMERAGIASCRIDAELRSFFDAVQHEMTRRSYAGQRSRPGGDAA
ncbi:DUF6074 family protein [Aurantimonas sp. 22II-16-19i]|uniref:DUF6074 family protein n=1 Tax=Aurantimonas sp. 22II-16-19i TaxID=1317114 RepID=UPI0009F7DC64|nr:DUF6074 family protein [Aurantimonas sp. 22II-16-19i]ORE97471.1 hypothetical protein ATO4_09132 [Aurantimonas sp. 22II-16-19i]